ncbi:MAG: lytic transglycosylase domain-containing protein [Solirubrobacterales bacterium]
MDDEQGGNAGLRKAAEVVHIGVKAVAGWKVALIVLAVIAGLLFFTGLLVASASQGEGSSGMFCTVVGEGNEEIPPEYVPWLQKAATKYELGPRGFSIVAAIHKIESDFGRSTLPGVKSGTNEAGAAGPGQFLAGTWTFYGVDGNNDGFRDIYSVPDSVFSTANYLHASGAPKDWRGAIFEYNHATWYVEEVLEQANKYDAGVVCKPVLSESGEAPAGGLARIEYFARWIESKRIHYCWGGGHGPKPGPSPGSGEFCGPGVKGLDCSGSVRWLLVLTGYPDPGGLRSDELGAHYPAGPGQHVTIWANVDHVFITINGRDWGTSSSNVANGPGFADHTHAGFVPSHPQGM